MIHRYIGNKSPIVSEILSEISRLAPAGSLVFDAFSGTLAVSTALKSAGYRVAANDINHFSWVYSTAYLANSCLPAVENSISNGLSDDVETGWTAAIEQLTSPYPRGFPSSAKRTDIYDHYCEEGKNSAFNSLRGSSGHRRFFSPQNAKTIDRALNKIRYWFRSGEIGEETRCILTAVLMDAVERVSNTQGTFHDFPRKFVDPRALKPISIVAPKPNDFVGPASTIIGKAQDTLEFVHSVPTHAVLYLDPPYNFRQYTSYYFMLNLLSKYPELDDLDAYFAEVKYVRGQNMDDDFSSTFCSSKTFLSSIRTLIERAKCEYIVLSYFDGRNHWGSFKSSGEANGKRALQDFFETSLFKEGSQKCIPIDRLNYQSYGGHKAKIVKEFLFIAKKSNLPSVQPDDRGEKWIGQVSA